MGTNFLFWGKKCTEMVRGGRSVWYALDITPKSWNVQTRGPKQMGAGSEASPNQSGHGICKVQESKPKGGEKMKTGRRYEWDQKQYEAEHPCYKNGWMRYGPHYIVYEKVGVCADVIAKGLADKLPLHQRREFKNVRGKKWFPAFRKIDLNMGRNGYPAGKVGTKKGQVQVAFREPIRTKKQPDMEWKRAHETHHGGCLK